VKKKLNMTPMAIWLVFCALAMFSEGVHAFTVKKLCESEAKPSSAEANVMRLICVENYNQTEVGQELEQVDMIMNGYYKAARERSQDKDKLLQAQKIWIKERNACKDTDCLRRVYHRRIMELALVPAKAAVLDMTYKAVEGNIDYILTRENGLKQFDDGNSDFDIVTTMGYEEDSKRHCDKASYHLIGSGITIKTRCKTSEYGVYKSATTEDGKSFQLFLAYQPSMYFIDERFGSTLSDGSRIFDEDISSQFWPRKDGIPNTDEPMRRATRRIDTNGGVIWHWVLVARKPFKQPRNNYSSTELWRWMLLPDGSIISTNYGGAAFRLDPNTGKPYDTQNFRVFTVDQAVAWRKAWAEGYVKKTPNCQGDIRRCPDKKAASDYLFKRFDEEMSRQFGDVPK
jgi:uncharacterized protein